MQAGKKAPAITSGKGHRQDSQSLPSATSSIKVLVRVFADGYCEVFSEGRIHFHCQKILQSPSQAGERLAVEYADLTLPLSHRGLDDCRKLVATFDTRPASVSQFISMQASLSALRIMDAYSARASK
jgi:hypothetical protein